MSKLAIIPIFFLTMCGTAPVTPPAEACTPPIDGSDFKCPPFDNDYLPPKPKPLIQKEELRGEIDIYNPMHWHQMQTMFQRNVRRENIEKNATSPTDAINKALMEFENGSNGSTESQELLQLSSDGNKSSS